MVMNLKSKGRGISPFQSVPYAEVAGLTQFGRAIQVGLIKLRTPMTYSMVESQASPSSPSATIEEKVAKTPPKLIKLPLISTDKWL